MIRGQDETSTSQVVHRKGSSQESPTASSLMSFMSMEKLRSFYRVPNGISLEFSDESTLSTVGQADNVVYFTQEKFLDGLRFPVSSLLKQFLHVTQAPPTFIHPNVFGF